MPWAAVVAKGATAQGLVCLTHVFVCIRITFSPYIVAIVCLFMYIYLRLTTMKKEQKFFDKSLQIVNDTLLNAFHKMLLLTVD
jgi:hypothetical protein